MPNSRIAALALLLLLTACGSMRYDLADVPFPVHASASSDGGESFELKSKYVLYVHGLLGDKQPRVAELMNEHLAGAKSVSNFRVSSGANFWDWLGTHLSLGLVRLKTVKISGQVSR